MIDGQTSFAAGIDQSRQPQLIGPANYAGGVNVYVPFNSERIKTRPGIHHCVLEFPGDKGARTIYETGHVQGLGKYRHKGVDYHVRVVSGYVFEFVETRYGVLSGRIRNRGFPNSGRRTKAWVCAVPGGAIINDGQSLPIYITPTESRRTCPDCCKEIGVGRMMAYVQDRLFYVNEESNFIYASDYRDPLKLNEAYANNIFGFALPDANDAITAIGYQKSLARDVNGGELVFSSADNIYSADVRGALSDWGMGDGLGVARLVLAGVGATSPYAFTNFNTNLWFRSPDGIVGFKQIQSQFVQEDSILSSSAEVQPLLANDTQWMLDQCQSVNWNNRLVTTVTPSLSDEGYVFWNALLVMSPSPTTGPDRFVGKRFDGLWTGVRPWGMISVGDRMFIDSHDEDKVNRIYMLVEGTDYDTNSRGQQIEIEGHIETRSYVFEKPFTPKVGVRRQLGLYNITRDVVTRTLTREDATGEWREFDRRDFLVKSRCDDASDMNNFQPQDRRYLTLPDEGFRNTPSIGDVNGQMFYHRQYRWEFKGSAELGEIVVEAKDSGATWVPTPKESSKTGLVYELPDDYRYSIQTSIN